MIDRQHNKIVFECDCCPETFESETEDFSEAWAAAKREGWRNKQVGGVWLHSCGAVKCRL